MSNERWKYLRHSILFGERLWQFLSEHINFLFFYISGYLNWVSIKALLRILRILNEVQKLNGWVGNSQGHPLICSHPTLAKLTVIYTYRPRCESPVHGPNGLTSPPKDFILLWFNYPIKNLTAMFVNMPTTQNKHVAAIIDSKHTLSTVIAALCFIPLCGHINKHGQFDL